MQNCLTKTKFLRRYYIHFFTDRNFGLSTNGTLDVDGRIILKQTLAKEDAYEYELQMS